MRKIINRKIFDTQSAELVCQLTCTAFRDDFGWHDTSLYRTNSGTWFLAGQGNGSSMWKKQAVGGGSIPGEGIRVIVDDEALEILEAEDEDWAIESYFEVDDA